MKRIVQLVALVLTEATAIIALVSIGRAPFMKIDLRAADPIDSLMALLRVVALGAVLWLAASTVAYLAAGARRARLPRWFTIPFVRRVVDRAIAVAIVGLIVNLVSAFLLRGEHHYDHSEHLQHHHDHNLRGAYLHVLADALTSILAILARSEEHTSELQSH